MSDKKECVPSDVIGQTEDVLRQQVDIVGSAPFGRSLRL